LIFGVLRNHLTKLQPFIYSPSTLPRVTTALVLSLDHSNLHTPINKSHNKNFSIQCRHQHFRYSFLRYNIPDKTILKQYSTSSDGKTSQPQVLHDHQKSTIEDFRTREEQREEEYSNQNTRSNDEEKKDDKIQEIRSKIMDAALPFVSHYGWSRETISKGAESIGYPGVVHGMFPKGGIELVHYFYLRCNQQLIEQLKSEMEKKKSHNPVEFVTRAVQLRLQMIEPYSAHWPQALGLMSLPPNVPTSLAHLLTLVDDICYYAGDRSVDFGWYTRRIGLATIYKMTELYMLQDKSMEHLDTWKFLERRIEEGNQIQEVLNVGDQTTKKALNSAFLTARNILGINFNRR